MIYYTEEINGILYYCIEEKEKSYNQYYKFYYLNETYCAERRAASIMKNNNTIYYYHVFDDGFNYQCHRIDGPAMEYFSSPQYNQYYLYGIKYSEKEYKKWS